MLQDCKSKPDLKAHTQRNIFIVSSIECHYENEWFKKCTIFFLDFVTLIVFIREPNFPGFLRKRQKFPDCLIESLKSQFIKNIIHVPGINQY